MHGRGTKQTKQNKQHVLMHGYEMELEKSKLLIILNKELKETNMRLF